MQMERRVYRVTEDREERGPSELFAEHTRAHFMSRDEGSAESLRPERQGERSPLRLCLTPTRSGANPARNQKRS